MEQPRQTEFTADEFIAWALEQPTGRFELDNGIVVAMAPERASHTSAKLNAVIALRRAIGTRGLPVQAFPDGMSVRVNDRTVYEPDALVRCGPPPAAATRTRPPSVRPRRQAVGDVGELGGEVAGELPAAALEPVVDELALEPLLDHRPVQPHRARRGAGQRDRDRLGSRNTSQPAPGRQTSGEWMAAPSVWLAY